MFVVFHLTSKHSRSFPIFPTLNLYHTYILRSIPENSSQYFIRNFLFNFKHQNKKLKINDAVHFFLNLFFIQVTMYNCTEYTKEKWGHIRKNTRRSKSSTEKKQCNKIKYFDGKNFKFRSHFTAWTN